MLFLFIQNDAQINISYDDSGVIFGVMCGDTTTGSHSIRLFDVRNYQKGPFQDIAPTKQLIDRVLAPKVGVSISPVQLVKHQNCKWTDFEFSGDGNHLLVNTNSNMQLILDGFKPETEPIAICQKNELGCKLGACWSPDARLVIGCSPD